MDVRSITSAEARSVRLPVLRPGLPSDTAIFDHDDDPGTRHFGVFDGARLIGVATFFAEPYSLSPRARAWRLRGMATLPDMQGRGGGRALVEAGVAVARADGAELMWCNARVSARGFYEKLGFKAVGDEFVLPVAGPHYVMVRDISGPA
jgi:GNAT superfamily N-acetyltransferase